MTKLQKSASVAPSTVTAISRGKKLRLAKAKNEAPPERKKSPIRVRKHDMYELALVMSEGNLKRVEFDTPTSFIFWNHEDWRRAKRNRGRRKKNISDNNGWPKNLKKS